jgi:methionyl-tRNA synthetase
LGLLTGKVASKEDKSSSSSGYFSLSAAKDRLRNWTSKSSKQTKEEALWREALNFASSVSDSRFLLQLNTAPVDECLHDATVEAQETVYAYLRKLIESLVDGIGQQIFSIQKAECDAQIQREVTSGENKELEILRSDFVLQVEASSRKRSRSYVHHNLG